MSTHQIKEFSIALTFELNENEDPEQYVESLYENGCDDSLIGIGRKGFIAFDFIREGDSKSEVMESATNDVLKNIPHAKLIEFEILEE